MQLPTVFRSDVEKAKATVDRLQEKLDRATREIAEFETTFAEQMLAAYDGDAKSIKQRDDARSRQQKLETEQKELAAALALARKKLEQAELDAKEEAARRDLARVKELINVRVKAAKQAEAAAKNLREHLAALDDTTSELEQLLRQRAIGNNYSLPTLWANPLTINSVASRVAEYVVAIDLGKYMGIARERPRPDTRDLHVVEGEAMTRLVNSIDAEIERQAKGQPVHLDRRRKPAA